MPVGWLAIRAARGGLGADPIREIENELGLSALIFLIAATACSPARRLWGWTWAMRVRRELGLFAFGYALIHFLTYMLLDQFFDWNGILQDILQRPFITVGFSALVLLTPVAITSTNGWVKRLGFARWQRIHWLVYPAAILAGVHFVWRVKLDVRQPLAYALVIGVLLFLRITWWLRKRYAQGTALT